MDESFWEQFAESKILYGEPLVGASEDALQGLITFAGTDLPASYLQMLRRFNGRGDELYCVERALETNRLYDHV